MFYFCIKITNFIKYYLLQLIHTQNDTKINNNKKSKNIQYETIEVMSQELERKVLENGNTIGNLKGNKKKKKTY